MTKPLLALGALVFGLLLGSPPRAAAQSGAPAVAPAPAAAPAPASQTPPADESALGDLLITGTVVDKLPKIAVLPSLAPDPEDVHVRSVVRRDIELTGMFELIPDAKAPASFYSFDEPVDVAAWQALGAEAIVKVAARPKKGDKDKVEVFGLAYFLNVGKDPVYQKKFVVDRSVLRVTAHRVTDALLGALTGRPGGFASQFTFSGRWTKNRRIFRMDSDGHGLTPLSSSGDTAIAPSFGPGGLLVYSVSKQYLPFALVSLTDGVEKPFKLPFATSIYSSSYSHDGKKLAVAVAEKGRSVVYVGNPDGSGMTKVSNTELATHPAFSPSGKLAWIGGDGNHGSQRVYVDGKPASPNGFSASAPTFCDTEDGVRLVYAVSVGGGRRDLVMADELGRGVSRLTQGQGSNSYPACSPDGRMLAFFSTRNQQPGIYMMSLKRFTALQITAQVGESLRWAPLP
jgi:TolB protein